MMKRAHQRPITYRFTSWVSRVPHLNLPCICSLQALSTGPFRHDELFEWYQAALTALKIQKLCSCLVAIVSWSAWQGGNSRSLSPHAAILPNSTPSFCCAHTLLQIAYLEEKPSPLFLCSDRWATVSSFRRQVNIGPTSASNFPVWRWQVRQPLSHSSQSANDTSILTCNLCTIVHSSPLDDLPPTCLLQFGHQWCSSIGQNIGKTAIAHTTIVAEWYDVDQHSIFIT